MSYEVATVKSPESVQVCEAISDRCISLQRNVKVQNTRVILSMILKYYVNALCSHRRDISLYMISRHAITLKVLENSKNVKEYLF